MTERERRRRGAPDKEETEKTAKRLGSDRGHTEFVSLKRILYDLVSRRHKRYLTGLGEYVQKGDGRARADYRRPAPLLV